MRADPFVQLKLLDVQQLDIEIDQNRHRARELPAIFTVNDLAGRQSALRDHTVAAATRASDLSRELRKAESDVEQVRARAERLCSYQKRIAVQTERACTLEKCLTNYQCVTPKDVKTYGL